MPEHHEPCAACVSDQAGDRSNFTCADHPKRLPARPLDDLLAERFHDIYESVAAHEGWETQQRSRKPWAEVPEANKATMRAVMVEMRAQGYLRVPYPGGESDVHEEQVTVRERIAQTLLRCDFGGSGYMGTADCYQMTDGMLPLIEAEVERIVAERITEALRDAADAALTMYDPPVEECITWSEWLRARADYRRIRPDKPEGA